MEGVVALTTKLLGNADAVTPLWYTLYDSAAAVTPKAPALADCHIDNVFLLAASFISNCELSVDEVLDLLGRDTFAPLCVKLGVRVTEDVGCCGPVDTTLPLPILAIVVLTNMHLDREYQLVCRRHFFAPVPEGLSLAVMHLLMESVVFPSVVSHTMFVSVSTLSCVLSNFGRFLRSVVDRKAAPLLECVYGLMSCTPNLLCVDTNDLFDFVAFVLRLPPNYIVYDLIHTIAAGLDLYRLCLLLKSVLYERRVSHAIFSQIVRREQAYDFFEITLNDYDAVSEFVVFTHVSRCRLYTHTFSYEYWNWLRAREDFNMIVKREDFRGLLRLLETTLLPQESLTSGARAPQ